MTVANISFVIPARNEEELAPRLVENIHEVLHAFDGYQFIVVDHSSTDRTAVLAATAGARVLHSRARTVAGVRNVGAREAIGDVLIFLDADVTDRLPSASPLFGPAIARHRCIPAT